MYANAGQLFRNAVDLFRGVSSLNAASDQAQRECLASVIFAAMSTEAFINELAQLATDAAEDSAEPAWVGRLGEVLRNAVKSRGSTRSKYDSAMEVLIGKVLDKGAQPFEDFALLISLRNLVVHLKPEDAVLRKEADGAMVWETEILRTLRERGAITMDDLPPRLSHPGEVGVIHSNLLEKISTQSVGRWSCGAAAGIVNAVLNAMPASPRFASLLETIYRKDFQIRDN